MKFLITILVLAMAIVGVALAANQITVDSRIQGSDSLSGTYAFPGITQVDFNGQGEHMLRVGMERNATDSVVQTAYNLVGTRPGRYVIMNTGNGLHEVFEFSPTSGAIESISSMNATTFDSYVGYEMQGSFHQSAFAKKALDIWTWGRGNESGYSRIIFAPIPVLPENWLAGVCDVTWDNETNAFRVGKEW